MELREDVTVPEMGNFRWLTVGLPGQPDVALALLAVPGPPVFDDETPRPAQRRWWPRAPPAGSSSPPTTARRATRSSRAAASSSAGADAAALRHRRGFRDPSGNQMRMAQLG